MGLLGISYIYMDYLIVIKLLENHSIWSFNMCEKEKRVLSGELGLIVSFLTWRAIGPISFFIDSMNSMSTLFPDMSLT